jgi:hypothetical protein
MSGDVQDTLNELERKLRELQAELAAPGREAGAGEASPADVPSPPVSPPPAPSPPPAAGPVEAQLEELLRFRDQLAEAAAKLVEDYSRLLEQISRIADVPPPPTPAAGHVTFPVPPPAAPSPESALYAGEVTIEAAPFGDIAALAAFEEALRQVPNAADVVVRSFDQGRAVIGLRLEAEMPLVFELRRVSDQAFDVEHAEPGRLVLAVHSGDLPFPMRP